MIMDVSHIIKIYVNGEFVSEYEATEIATSKENAVSYCRKEEDGTFLATKGMMFVDRTEETVRINFSYDIFFFDWYSCKKIEKDGSYYYCCDSKALGTVEVFIGKVDIFPEYDQCIQEYFGL
jgi:hypothetical protein